VTVEIRVPVRSGDTELFGGDPYRSARAWLTESQRLRKAHDEAIQALRALNSAIWLAHPEWAIAVPETARATELIAAQESENRNQVNG